MGFLLTRQWRDTSNGIELELWFYSDEGPFCVIIDQQQTIFFIRDKDSIKAQALLNRLTGVQIKSLSLKNFNNEAVKGVYCNSQNLLYQARRLLEQNQIEYYEADIRPIDRYLMERFITARATIHFNKVNLKKIPDQGYRLVNPIIKCAEKDCNIKPSLNILSIDIETAYDTDELFSISLLSETLKKTLMIGDPKDGNTKWLEYYSNEKDLLQQFIVNVQECDPDCIIGWNVVAFDLLFLQKKSNSLNVPLAIGRNGSLPIWRTTQTEPIRHFLLLPGRVVLDGIDTLKSATWHFDSFSLESVANTILNRGKLIKSAPDINSYDPLYKAKEIKRLFYEDKLSLAAYNLEDCQLVMDVFKQTDLLTYAMEKANLTGLEMDRVGGSVAAFDNLYLPRLHRKGYIASSSNECDESISAPGGYVMNSKPGLYDSVIVLDYKSLYPSIIRTFKVDPYASTKAIELTDEQCIEGFKGIKFARKDAILPEIIASLWSARDKARTNKQKALAQAIKIIMNSFYGVLGNKGCRVHDARLTSSITMRGHEIIKKTVELIESSGYSVIYGDTDSVFVSLGKQQSQEEADCIGQILADSINQYWLKELHKNNLKSYLEMEYETHFLRFFMPTIRDSDKGSKKRYAGVVESLTSNQNQKQVVFKGLEAVRSDWTSLAKEIQTTIYEKIFYNESFEDYLREIVDSLKNGLLDDKLIYKKRLRQKLIDYKKNRPPHAQAALKAEQYANNEQSHKPYGIGSWIHYVITSNGPEPIEYNSYPIDYQHYIDKQIAPVVDPILACVNNSLSKIINAQFELF